MQSILKLMNKVRDSKVYQRVTDVILPLILCIFGMLNFNKGINITDTGYNYTNFRFISSLDDMWLFSTYMSNVIGAFLTKLPFGNTLLGLNFYTGLLKCAIAIVAYYFFTRYLKKDKELVFLCEVMALGLCWCPTALLYNYLTYMLFSLVVIFLYIGLTKDKNKYFVFAGVALGINVMVRFPNVAETALILVVWFYAFLNKSKMKKVIQQTLFCIAGFAGSILTILGYIVIRYGWSRYMEGIQALFGMTNEAADYSPIQMVLSIVRAYCNALHWVLPLIAVVLFGLLINLIIPKRWFIPSLIAGAVLGYAALFIEKELYLFDFKYYAYNAISNYGSVILVLMILILVAVLFARIYSKEEKTLAFAMLVVIGISPLGSNNQLFVNLNNMFLVAPAVVYLVIKAYRPKLVIPLCILAVVCAGFWYQSVRFGAEFVFRDGGTEPINTQVTNNEVLKGMYTTEANAERMYGISKIWLERDLSKGTVLLYDNVSSMAFYLNTEPAISTTWPDLRSFSLEKMRTEISQLSNKLRELKYGAPAIILGYETNNLISTNGKLNEKQEIIHNFIDEFCYDKVYENDQFALYLPRQ